jgi:putative hydrolase of the HAD superfamily
MTQPAAPVHAVLFDYGMVLSGPANPIAWARMRSLTGLDEASLHRGYWEHRHAYDRGTHTGVEYWHLVVQTGGGLPLTPAQVDDLLQADVELWTDINPPMLAWAAELQQAGIPTGILSNIGDAMAEGIVAKFAWIDHFTHTTWSHTLKLAKPERAIYQHAAAGLNTPPDNILFIDDRADNLQGAEAAGMQTIQYSAHDAFVEEMYARGYSALLHPLATRKP